MKTLLQITEGDENYRGVELRWNPKIPEYEISPYEALDEEILYLPKEHAVELAKAILKHAEGEK